MRTTDDGQDDFMHPGPSAGSGWKQDAPYMTRAAWEALSDPDAPLLGDDLPDLDEADGSTR